VGELVVIVGVGVWANLVEVSSSTSKLESELIGMASLRFSAHILVGLKVHLQTLGIGLFKLELESIR
jgi:hypothetical protein